MPFNADTYYANKYRRTAFENLATAREIKARAKAGTAYEWEIPRIATFAKLARIDMRISLSIRRGQAQNAAAVKRIHRRFDELEQLIKESNSK